jgi:hypothetical protein
MTKFRQLDILVELIELCKERTTDIRQQLVYYRASVYKHEMATTIKTRLSDLRLLSDMLGDDLVLEPFRDFEIRAINAEANCAPGECSFSHRVAILLSELEHQFHKLGQGLSGRTPDPEKEPTLDALVRKNQAQLVALCRHGSRQRRFFETF